MLWSPNLQDRAVFAMYSLKVSSKITPRFLTEADGVIVDEPNWIVKSCCRVGVAGKIRSSVFARLSCRWHSFIHAEMSARQPEIRAATFGSSGRDLICVDSFVMNYQAFMHKGNALHIKHCFHRSNLKKCILTQIVWLRESVFSQYIIKLYKKKDWRWSNLTLETNS